MRPLLATLLLLSACGKPAVCEAGRQTECACGDDAAGFQVCADDGSAWGECVCEDESTDDDTTDDETDVVEDDTDVVAPECSDLDDCGDCLACDAEEDTCATEWAACAEDAYCPALTECVIGCDLEGTCSNDCYYNASGGEALAGAAIECSRAATCSAVCPQ